MTGSRVVHILWLQECLWESLSKQWLNCLGVSSTFTLLVFDNQQKKEEQDGNPQVRFLYPYHLHLQTHTHTQGHERCHLIQRKTKTHLVFCRPQRQRCWQKLLQHNLNNGNRLVILFWLQIYISEAKISVLFISSPCWVSRAWAIYSTSQTSVGLDQYIMT